MILQGNSFLAVAIRLTTTLILGGVVGAALAQDGAALAQKAYDRPDGDDVTSVGEMILTEKGKSPRKRQMYSFGRDNTAGDSWSLIRFMSPADVKGTGLLSLDLASGKEDQWVYLPALKRSRRIPAGRKGGRFVGSDIVYEDMQDRKPGEDTHSIVGSEKVNGVDCTMLESVPKDAASSTYKKRVSCINEKMLVALRTDYYQGKSDKPSKRYEVRRIKKLQGFWTVMESVVTDLKTGHETTITTDTVKYDQGLPESLFAKQALEDSSVEEQYRP